MKKLLTILFTMLLVGMLSVSVGCDVEEPPVDEPPEEMEELE